MSLLILGSTGTLGRQIVRKALDEGFQVKCFVRNFRKASFLKQWGAELIYGDLKLPETIPGTLYGITAIIDASTVRHSDFYAVNTIELESKKILIKAAMLAQVKRYIFFSFFNVQNYQAISLMNLKVQVEEQLKESNLDYTIFSICGFFQGLIQQYALPILDKQSIWVTQESQAIPYIDTQDVAKFTIKSLSLRAAKNRLFVLAGNYAWTSFEIIELCEKLSGQKSKISPIPIFVLQFLRQITKMFQWSWNISERLAFTNLLIEKKYFDTSTDDFFYIFQIGKNDFNSLENYLQEYFTSILKKMKELNEQKKDTNYLDSF
uniref:Conserved hypothetical plastid protein n=1 Tax=Calliarthron tuberculosum TaxID=48942 RepID=M4IV79_CALTB|nr:conserved hypothetical plastid protein [Calliarthron tuberculosum]AGA63892.1 conserved hypothetical plastid protein [Calliarthron tuberculosum]